MLWVGFKCYAVHTLLCFKMNFVTAFLYIGCSGLVSLLQSDEASQPGTVVEDASHSQRLLDTCRRFFSLGRFTDVTVQCQVTFRSYFSLVLFKVALIFRELELPGVIDSSYALTAITLRLHWTRPSLIRILFSTSMPHRQVHRLMGIFRFIVLSLFARIGR